MNSINEIISYNIRKIRQERDMTLDTMSQLSGVSKSMLSDIERGRKSPTLSILSKICDGVGVSFAHLTKTQTPEVQLVKKDDMKDYSFHENSQDFVLFPFDSTTKFEVHRHILEAKFDIVSEGHAGSVREHCIVIKGNFKIQILDRTYELDEGDAIQFLANCRHRYLNDGDKPVEIITILFHN